MHCEYKKRKHMYLITSHHIDNNGDILETNIAQSGIMMRYEWMHVNSFTLTQHTN